MKINVKFDLETFKHSLRNLTKREICLILQQYNCDIDTKLSKADIMDNLIKKACNNEIIGEMYYTFREKAFSIDNNFYDGFFYKIDEFYGDFGINCLYDKLMDKAHSTKNDERICISLINKDENSIIFNFERSKNKDFYDYDSQTSRSFKQLLNAGVEIYRNTGLVYIHSKNLTDSKIIKTFLDKCFVAAASLIDKRKKVLSEPRFQVNIADSWQNDNIKVNDNKINSTTLHMMDLYFEFESDKCDFSSVRMKSIYLKENTLSIGDNETQITDTKYGGNNLQEHKKVIEEIINGKRILGFKLETEYLYQDEETGEEMPTVLPITILYEDKNYLRISISSDCLSTQKPDVLRQAYNSAKHIFENKFISKSILNGDKLLEYLHVISEQGCKSINNQYYEDQDSTKEKTSQVRWNY